MIPTGTIEKDAMSEIREPIILFNTTGTVPLKVANMTIVTAKANMDGPRKMENNASNTALDPSFFKPLHVERKKESIVFPRSVSQCMYSAVEREH
mmetsp:Transcript_14898/g.22327  ORF Transcript_14898/g.22327 Transcript_14898/m.22327 type:complete len:95 (-) Transcript_14898:463-747(-)